MNDKSQQALQMALGNLGELDPGGGQPTPEELERIKAMARQKDLAERIRMRQELLDGWKRQIEERERQLDAVLSQVGVSREQLMEVADAGIVSDTASVKARSEADGYVEQARREAREIARESAGEVAPKSSHRAKTPRIRI